MSRILITPTAGASRQSKYQSDKLVPDPVFSPGVA